jgi:tRNA1(Val) A37 N6-methylase TrmN6
MVYKDTPLTVLPGERIDNLERGGLRIIQSPDAFCFSVDAVLLAHFAVVRSFDRVMDLCTGTAIIPLLLSTRAKGLRQWGIELNGEVAERATRSVALNGLSESITISQGDVRQIRDGYPHGSFDLVTANPPYLPLAQGEMSTSDLRRMARHELTANLRDVVAAAQWLLPTGGRFAMVHRPNRLTDILVTLREHRLEPKRLRLVHPAEGKEACMVLVESTKDAKPELKLGAPLYIHQQDGNYSEQLRTLYAGGELA